MPPLKNHARTAISIALLASTTTFHNSALADWKDSQSKILTQAIPTGTTSPAIATPPGVTLKNTVNIKRLNPNTIKRIGGYKINTDSIRRLISAQELQASRIRSVGSFAKLISNQATISEAGDGVLIASKISYSLKFGACLEHRQQLLQAGIKCNRSSDAQKSIEKLSDPSSERYIANPQQREEARKSLEAAKARFEKIGSQIKATLQDPRLTQKLNPKLKVTLLQASNADIANEVLNSGTVEVSQAIYIPSASTLVRGLSKTKLLEGNTIQNLMKPNPVPKPARTFLRQQSPKNNKGSSIEPKEELLIAYGGELSQLLASGNTRKKAWRQGYFLSGFTFGKQYNWSKRISKTINPCWPLDCPETLYVEPYARFGYGLGLRFPIETRISFEDSGNHALVELEARAIDGSKRHYTRVGVGQDQVFNGKELVAEIGGEAGFRYNVYVKNGSKEVSLGYDLTEKLPRPFKNGNFTPPSAENPTAVIAPIFFEDIDLLAGQANFGVAWAKVHPGIKAELTSRNLSFTLADNNPGGRNQTIRSGDKKRVSISNSVADVTLKDPNYNIGFTITPGVRGRIGVDLYVWEDDWRYDVWIPELSITLPPRGANFSCHAGTTCTQNYTHTRRNSNPETSNQAPPAQQTQPPHREPPSQRLQGWWRGNRTGFYSIQTSGSSFEMKGFSNNGFPVNLFTGTIRGNRISGSWKNFCDERTGNAVLAFSNSQLTRISGATANSRWLRSSRPRAIQSTPNCNQRRRKNDQNQPPAAINLNGQWRANDGGTYSIRQSGKSISWKGSGGNFRNSFNGQIKDNMIVGFWQDTASSQTQNSGQLTLRVENGNRLVRVSHTGAFTGSIWNKL